MKRSLKNIFSLVVLFTFFSSGCALAEKKVISEKKEDKGVASDLQYPLAPDFRLNDLDDKEVLLSSFRGKQGVVLFFWTTWCPYCRDALKELQDEYISLAKDGVVVLAINVGERKSKVVSFIKSRKFSFRVLLDTDYNVSDKYDLMGVPSYFLVNKGGQVVLGDNHFPREKLKEITNVR